jgi:hypothetical protein
LIAAQRAGKRGARKRDREEDQYVVKSVMVAGCLLAAALGLEPVAAQVLYKSTLPDGRVVYGDKPEPGAARVDESKPDTSKRGIGGTASREAEALKELEQARQKREGGEDKLRAAEQALKDAEAARAAGKDPLPGERAGAAGGASRLAESYFERQRKLEEAVDKARRELEQARSGK